MKVLLSGGGTAGHITPLLAVARELLILEPGVELSFIGQKGDKNTAVIENSGVIPRLYSVRAGKFRRFHSLTLMQNIVNFKVNLLNFRDIFLIVVGFFQSLLLLISSRPDVIFFKGGFVVVPVGFAARILRIPYITHDSDPIPGLANRLIAGGARKNAVVSSEVKIYPAHKTVVTGVPLIFEYTQRRGVEQAEYKEKLGFPKQSTLLFVFTGTQGSRVVDDALEVALSTLLPEYEDLHVAYVFGRLNEASMETRFSTLNDSSSKRLHRMKFIDNAFDYIAASDIIVGRAGATSMAEFATVGRATILVPAEQLTGGHQLMNAKIFEEKKAAVVVSESDLSDGALYDAIKTLLDTPGEIHRLQKAILELAPENASRELATEIVKIAGMTP